MADFIAVIRRAVDGLSDNTPEMRVKVYERARSAVVKQLENMKPRPPEAMFQRQLDKLDAAIREVESEHAEALAADDDQSMEPQVEAAQAKETAVEPVYEEPAEPWAPAELPASAQVQSAAETERHHESISEPDHGKADDEAPEALPAQPLYEDAAPETGIEPDTIDKTADEVEPVGQAEPVAAWHDDHAAEQETEDHAEPEPESHEKRQFSDPVEEIAAEAAPAAPPMQWPVEVDSEPEVEATEPAPEEPAMPRVSYDESDVVAGFNEFVQEEMNRRVVPPPPRKVEPETDFSWDTPFDDLPEIPKSDTFEQALVAKQRELAADVAAARDVADIAAPVTARSELEDLIGFEPEPVRPTIPEAAAVPPDVSHVVSRLEGKSFKVHKKSRKSGSRGILPLTLAIVGILIVGGGAYGFWTYRDTVSELVSGIMPQSMPADVATQAATGDATTKSATAEKEPQTEVASLDTDAATQKFTQRLLPDGSEASTDTAQVPVDQALPEGKTVAGQTEKGKEVASAVTDTKPAATDTKNPAADPAQPVGVAQKMFLYEERLGQSSPVAVPGTVIWREKTDNTDGKPDPEIEAEINIPQRSMKALISFKRNTDTSLPASHIIEIVFSLPKDFEDGNIESVQRVSFKQTEQDPGNALIAVPAKITDDFHMIALNDDAEARKTNLDLMKNRSWIDIPVTYRNGRRALLTLEKGASGTAAFDKVMGKWSALGPQTTNN